MIQVNKASILQPVKRFLEADSDTFVVVKHATLGDEGRRWDALFADKEVVYLTESAGVEMWLTIVECNILDENSAPLLTPGMQLEDFVIAATALLEAAPAAFWEISRFVREVNPQWQPAKDERVVGDAADPGNA